MQRSRVRVLAPAIVMVFLGCGSEPTEPPHISGPETSVPSLAVKQLAPGRKTSVFLKYRALAPRDRLSQVMSLGAAFANDVRSERVLAIDAPSNRVEALRRLPWVVESEVDTNRYDLVADVVPHGVDVTDADLVQARGNKGTGVRVAFLDGGVQCGNVDLQGRIKGGYDFVLGNANYCTSSPQDASKIDHGTGVAQIIGAAINGAGFLGMAPEADLYSVRVCSAADACTAARIYSGLSWVRDNGMQVLSASIGNCGSGISLNLQAAMIGVNSAGIPQAWAAGNGSASGCSSSDQVSGFARMPFAIAVSAFNWSTGLAKSGYQYGPEIDISAPTDVQYVDIYGASNQSFGGTSGATPHVAGALALLIRAGFSGVDLLTQRLTSTATDAGAAGKDNLYGYGKLNAGVAAALRPAVNAISGPATPIKSAGTYALTASVANGVPPIAIKWDVTYSNGSHANVSTGYGSASFNLVVPSGSYSITVTATPRETTYLRVGFPLIKTYPVCTGGSVDPLMVGAGRGSVQDGGTVGPTAIGGC